VQTAVALALAAVTFAGCGSSSSGVQRKLEGTPLEQGARKAEEEASPTEKAATEHSAHEREREEQDAAARKALGEGEGEAKRQDEEANLPTPK